MRLPQARQVRRDSAQTITWTTDEARNVTDRAIDVQMVGLRRKPDARARHIETIRGIGYRLEL